MTESASDRPLTRGHKKKERTRRQLIEAAVDVIAERGEAFTVSDVATYAGVANGTFYNYFNDRDELIEAVLPEVLATFASEGAIAVAREDPVERFATISALALTRAAATPDAIKVMLRLDAIQQAIIDGVATEYLRLDLDAGARAGRFSFDDADAALDVIIGSLLMAARRTVDGGVGRSYHCGVIERLLCSLGVEVAEAASIADHAVSAAIELHEQSDP